MIAPNYLGDRDSADRLQAKRTWQSREPMTLNALVEHFLSQGLPMGRVTVSPGVFAHWYTLETDEELANRQRWLEEGRARSEKWERETLARLKAKYEDQPGGAS